MAKGITSMRNSMCQCRGIEEHSVSRGELEVQCQWSIGVVEVGGEDGGR